MTKSLILICSLAVFSFSAYACPELSGHYGNCQSEIRALSGEYLIEESVNEGTLYYFVQKTNPEENEEVTSETFRTDGVKVSRKEKVPQYGLTVRIDTRSVCRGDVVESKSDVFSLGLKVGSFLSKMSRVEGKLLLTIDGGYLNREVHKHITCEKFDQ